MIRKRKDTILSGFIHSPLAASDWVLHFKYD
jgi:hypothetical protein